MERQIGFASDDYHLHGVLHLPSAKNPPVVIGSHGLMSTGESPKQIALAEKCNACGIAYFRFDHRGCGRSSGEFSSATSFQGRCRDLESAIAFIRSQVGPQCPIGLFGSSYGGAVILAVAGRIETRALVTVAAPIRSEAINPPYLNDLANADLLQTLDKDKLKFDVSDRLNGICDLLLFHGENDNIVPVSNAYEIHEKVAPPKQLIRFENSDHTLSDASHQKVFIEKAGLWFEARLSQIFSD